MNMINSNRFNVINILYTTYLDIINLIIKKH